ncbi:hypothetical protein GCM10027456_20000 [Kineosporia babensis]
MGGTLLAAPAQAAENPSPPTIRVSGGPMQASLRMVGASDSGVVVEQGSDPTDHADVVNSLVYTGAEGGELTARPLIKATNYFEQPRLLVGVHGDELAWADPLSPYPFVNQAWYLHRMNLISGQDVIDAPAARPSAFNAGNWYTAAGLAGGEPVNLLRHKAGTGTGGKNGEMAIDRLMENAEGIVDLAADGSTVAVVRADPPVPKPGYPDSAPEGTRQFSLLLRDPYSGTFSTLVETTDVIKSVALGPDLLAWDSQAAGQSLQIHSRPLFVAEPVVSSYAETDPDAESVDLVANDQGVGYLVAGPTDEDAFPVPPAKDVELRVVKGENATTTELPDYSQGLAAVGDRFLTATGGAPKTAGVYSVSPGDVAVRTATVASATYPVLDVGLAGSSLYTLDRSSSSDDRHTVWKTAISGQETLTAGPRKRLGVNGSSLIEYQVSHSDRLFAFSAGRALIWGQDEHSWQLADRGRVTGVIQGQSEWGPWYPDVSGPYALLDTAVFKPNGDKVYEVRKSDYATGRAELFGSSIVYSIGPSYDEDTGAYETRVWLDDVENPDPQLLATYQGPCWRPPQVSIWGELVAWEDCDAEKIVVRNIRNDTERLIDNPFGSGFQVTDLQLSEGVLFWSNWVENAAEQYGGHLIDLNSPDAQRVDLLGAWYRFDLDDHLLTRALPGRDGAEVQRIPFAQQYRPRLIGKLAASRFTAGTQQWRPRFDVSKPMTDVRLLITDRNGATVKTLTGTAPDGSIRDIVWDGRDRTGRKMEPGTYHWRLLGQAADGDGSLIGKFGGSVVSGQVRVN